MKKFIMEKDFLQIFPDAKIGILVCNGIDNHIKDENRYADYLAEAQREAAKHITNPEFTENPIIRTWRDAFYKFKTKKGARCSIEALLKRVSKGGEIGCINPLVDIYNGISLKYGVPVGGEDIDKFQGDNRLTVETAAKNSSPTAATRASRLIRERWYIRTMEEPSADALTGASR